MLKKIWALKITRFLCVGVFNTVFDFTILNTLVFVGHLPEIVANLISASTSMSVSYFLNHHIVFRSQEKHSVKRFAQFFAVTGIGILAIQSLTIDLVTHFLDHEHSAVASVIHDLHIALSAKAFDLNVAKLLAVLLAMIWNFVIYQFVIFSKDSKQHDDDVLA